MKFNSSNRERARLRRDEFANQQNKSYIIGKKSLSKRIIQQHVDGITAENIDREVEKLGYMVKVEKLTATIMYHVKFARDARPHTFNDDVIIGILDRIKDLQVKLTAGIIDIKAYIEHLEEIDSQIIQQINGSNINNPKL